jgi:hypothetical protein
MSKKETKAQKQAIKTDKLLVDSVNAYHAINKELARFGGVQKTKEEIEEAHKYLIAMDDIYAEEIEPLVEFILHRYQAASSLKREHYAWKVENARLNSSITNPEDKKVISS